MTMDDIPSVAFGIHRFLLEWQQRKDDGLEGAELGYTLEGFRPRVFVTPSPLPELVAGEVFSLQLSFVGTGSENAGSQASVTAITSLLPRRLTWGWTYPLSSVEGLSAAERALARETGDQAFRWRWEVTLVSVKKTMAAQTQIDLAHGVTTAWFEQLDSSSHIDPSILIVNCAAGPLENLTDLSDAVHRKDSLPPAIHRFPATIPLFVRFWAAAQLSEALLFPGVRTMDPIYRLIFCGTSAVDQAEEGLEEHCGDSKSRSLAQDESIKATLSEINSISPPPGPRAVHRLLKSAIVATEHRLANNQFASAACESGLVAHLVEAGIAPQGAAYSLTRDDAADAVEQGFELASRWGGPAAAADEAEASRLSREGIYQFAVFIGVTVPYPLDLNRLLP